MASRRIYLDYAAAAPELPAVRRAVTRAAALFGNPSSIHRDGVRAAHALEEARENSALILGGQSDEIVFVGGGTESDNLAIMGVCNHARLDPEFHGKEIHIITTAIEHPAVLETCRHLETIGVAVTYLSVNREGLIDLKELRAALRSETILVSVAYANNEIGVVQPIRDIAKEIRHFKKQRAESSKRKAAHYPLFHTDACQAAAFCNLAVEKLGVDLLSLNGSKLGGPRGTGLLYVRRGTPIDSIFHGGGQERRLRSGTENLPGIVGFAAAFTEARRVEENECERLRALQEYFTIEIKNRFPGARLNGSMEFRLPNNVHVSFPHMASELLVLELDAKGISASAGSACSGTRDTGSEVLSALYGPLDQNEWGSLRFSMGRGTTKREIKTTLAALSDILNKYEPWNRD